jgi:hypothetical protein
MKKSQSLSALYLPAIQSNKNKIERIQCLQSFGSTPVLDYKSKLKSRSDSQNFLRDVYKKLEAFFFELGLRK